MDLLYSALSGLGGGILYGITGYAQAAKKEDLNVVKFGTSVLGAGLLGGIGGFAGLTPDAVSSASFGVVVTQMLTKFYHIL